MKTLTNLSSFLNGFFHTLRPAIILNRREALTLKPGEDLESFHITKVVLSEAAERVVCVLRRA